MEVEVVKFDNLGRGIGYINDKIIFIPKTCPKDIVKVNITLTKSKYLEGELVDIIKPSKLRKEVLCPYYSKCGGCDLMHIGISDSLEYKLEKVNDIFKYHKVNYTVSNIVKSDNAYNYRNKVSLKVENSVVGFYLTNSHTIIPIDECLLCNEAINKLISDIKVLNIKNGDITIRSNYKNELLIIINSKDKIDINDYLLNNHIIAGIIINDKCVYGESFFIDKINEYYFKVSYNSFFQINPYICSKLLSIIEDNTKSSTNTLDLYCGVGTLSIVASKYSHKVLGVEIVQNAISDAFLNKCLNKKDNLEFICSDTKLVLDKINNSIDTIILDPPRSGVNENILIKIMQEKIKKIIYVSCNPNTLARDLLLLGKEYDIKNVTLFDMFPNTEHVESVVILEKK